MCYEPNIGRTNILQIEQIKFRDIKTVKVQCFSYFFSKTSEASDARSVRFRKHQKHQINTKVHEQYI